MTATANHVRPVDRVLAALGDGARQLGQNQWEARCPAHDDRSPSLSVSEGDEGRALVHCHAGCATADVLAALHLADRDLFAEESRPERPQRRREVARFIYTDEASTPLYAAVKFMPGKNGRRKDFKLQPADGRRGPGAMMGVRRVLYRLPEVLAAVAEGRTVWVVEGEKDADALARAGEVATTNAQGAGAWSTVPDAAEVLEGAEVIVWVDDDAAGHKHGRQVAQSIDGRAARWTVVRSTTANDAAEHLGQGRELDALEVLAASDGDRSWLVSTDVDTTTADELHQADKDREPPPPALLFEDVAAVARRVDAAPPPRFLARPVWVADAYGVVGAEDKAGKSWAALDLAVAVASGGRWLDLYPCETPGPVLLFLGEGSDRKTIRRLRAVCEFHRADLGELAIRVCHRAPNLKRSDHLDAIAHELEHNPPRLVILDPLYLAVGDAKTSNLAEMGAVLGEIQYACQRAGAALVVVHHWNQTGTGNDRKRFTGAGAAEWGRVLASIAIDGKRTGDGNDSIVEQTWRFIGDEIPDTTARVVRRVWVDDLEDLTSPMHYAVTPPPAGGPHVAEDDTSRDVELRGLILDRLADGRELSGNALIAALRNAGHTVRDQDVRRVALELADSGPLRMRLGARSAHMFRTKEAQP